MVRKVKAACGCNMGKIRKNNEDNFYFQNVILPQENIGIENILVTEQPVADSAKVFGVFDGMGGEADGQIASYLSCQVLEKHLETLTLFPTKAKKNYEYIIQSMNNAVCAEAEVRFNRMGCTAAMLMFFENHVYLSNLGDSPIFRFRGGKLEQISVDHTDAEMLKKQGITKRKPHLTQCVGISPEEMQLQPYFYEERTKIGDRYLICSDGLTDMVSKDEIAKTLFEMKDIEQCVEGLIQKALDGGGRDNITVLLVDVSEGKVGTNVVEKLVPILKEKKSEPRVHVENHSESVKIELSQPKFVEQQREVTKAEVQIQSSLSVNGKPMKKTVGKQNSMVGIVLLLVVIVGVGIFGTTMIRKDSQKEEMMDIEESVPEEETSTEIVIEEDVAPTIEEENESVTEIVNEDELENEIIAVTGMDFDGDGNEDTFEYLISNDESETLVYLTISVNEFAENLAISCAYPLTEEDIIVFGGNLVDDKYSVVMQFVDSTSNYNSVEYHVINVKVTEEEMISEEGLTILDKSWERESFEESYFDLGFGAIQSVSQNEVIAAIEPLNVNGIRIRQARIEEDATDNEVFVYWVGDQWELYGFEAYKNCIKLHGDWDEQNFEAFNETVEYN